MKFDQTEGSSSITPSFVPWEPYKGAVVSVATASSDDETHAASHRANQIVRPTTDIHPGQISFESTPKFPYSIRPGVFGRKVSFDSTKGERLHGDGVGNWNKLEADSTSEVADANLANDSSAIQLLLNQSSNTDEQTSRVSLSSGCLTDQFPTNLFEPIRRSEMLPFVAAIGRHELPGLEGIDAPLQEDLSRTQPCHHSDENVSPRFDLGNSANLDVDSVQSARRMHSLESSYDSLRKHYIRLRMEYDLQLQRYRPLMEAHQGLSVEQQALSDQLQIQIKVNSELKKLLVASMGDDLHLKLESLTTAKAKLAQDIVHYTGRLSEDHETMEKLSIQCDVWRSKFLACSVLVDELSSWKSFLVQHLENCQSVVGDLLREYDELRCHLFQSFVLLKEIRDNFLPGDTTKQAQLLQYHSLYDLITGLHSVADALNHRLLADIRRRQLHEFELRPELGYSDVEQAARKILSIDVASFMKNDSCDDLHLNVRSKSCGTGDGTFACCKNCNGDVKVL